MEKIKILVVDDEQAESIKENVEGFTFRKGDEDVGCTIDTASTLEEAKKKISEWKKDKQFYDIMIIDMIMDEGDEAGLALFEMQLSCINIVLTAHPSIPNCVKCLNMGALDYIEKNAVDYDPYKKLKESMTRGLEIRLDPERTYDTFMRWLNSHLSEFIQQYSAEHIAVIDDVIVAHNLDYDELMKEVKRKYPFHIPRVAAIPDKEYHECLNVY